MSLFPQAKPPLPTEPDIALVVGRAPWWIPAGKTRKKVHVPLSQALRDFLQHLSFHCYGKVVEPGRRLLEKFFWLIFHIVALTVLIMFLWRTRNIDGQLLATTIFDPLYPIQKVEFPAVSICSVNRISNTSATKYAEELNAKDPMKRGVNFFYNEIKMLSYNYFVLDDSIDYESLLAFQRFLDIYDTEDYELFYNTRRRMQMLTPTCQNMLVKCSLGGVRIECSHAFLETITQQGYCCTFNSLGNYSKQRSFKERFFGPDKGLVLYLNTSRNDYFYRTSRLEGFIVMVYSHGNFPEIFSGGVRERIVLPGIETFISLSAKIVETVSQARYLSPKKRNCYFADELPQYFGKKYTFNKCITRCRMRSILVLCQCLPFYLPQNFLDVSVDTVACTLQHKECLKRYDYKWLNVITQRQNVRGLEREMEDALYCPECLPSCRETSYTMSLMGLPLNEHSHGLQNLTLSSPTVLGNNTDLSLLRVYFGEPHIRYLREIIKDDWYEVFSQVGNICSIIAGFSLIGICEVLFFLGKQLLILYQTEVMTDDKSKSTSSTKTRPLFILP